MDALWGGEEKAIWYVSVKSSLTDFKKKHENNLSTEKQNEKL